MRIEEKYKEAYQTKNTPWDAGKPDFNLIEVINQFTIQKCNVLDIGCGTGDNSIWLAQNGFNTIGIDSSDEALEKAKEKATKADVKCSFFNINFLTQTINDAPFGFAFDRGCFHSFDSEEERIMFSQNVAKYLESEGLWLTLIGNTDEQREIVGLPQLSAKDIVFAVEPYFEILSLTTSYFGSHLPQPPRAWRCLLKKRLVN